MSKDTPTKAVKKASGLVDLAEETGALFQPTKAQRALKARFWTILSNSMTSKNPHQMSQMEISRTVRDSRILNWWGLAGFQDWFMNNTEHIERLEYLFDLALTAAEDVLLSDDPKTSNAKVNMVKIIAELAKKMPSKGAEKFQDEAINKMSPEELRSYLSQHGVKVEDTTKVLEVTPTRDLGGSDED